MFWPMCPWAAERSQGAANATGISADDVRHLKPLPTQGWGPEEQNRLDNLGKNGPRNVEGLVMTHCVPNERVAVADGDREFVGAA